MSKTKQEKESVYFPHFVSARHDRKIRRVRKDLGIEGYGIFFMILEVLREQSDLRYPLEDIDLLADEFGTSEEKLKVVINKYGLFSFEDGYFYSPNQILYLKPYFEKSQRAKHAALVRWGNEKAKNDANADANALPKQSKSYASNLTKESNLTNQGKEVEKRVKRKAFTPPTVEEVKEYCRERDNSIDAVNFVNFYESKGWMVGKSKMKDWKASVRTWEVRDKQEKANRPRTQGQKDEDFLTWLNGDEYDNDQNLLGS